MDYRYSIFNAAIAFAYFLIPILLLPILKNAQCTIWVNLLLAIAFVFSCGIGHFLSAFHYHFPYWHLVTAIISWLAVIALCKSQPQLRYLSQTFQLLDATWNKSMTGNLLFKRVDDDLKLLKINKIGQKIFNNQLEIGDSLVEKFPIFLDVIYPQKTPLIQLYLQAFESGESQQIEIHYETQLTGHFINIFVPLSQELLYITFLDISPLNRDVLTGLYNRRFFNLETRQWQGCLYIDLDRFKRINDQRGHELGDKILIAVAETLQTYAKRYEGIAIREGGDEFILLFPIIDVYPIAVSILQDIQTLEIEGAKVSASIGIATNNLPECEQDKSIYKLRQISETATREAKCDRRSELPENRIRLWTRELASQYARQMLIESYLRQPGIENERWLVYQPIVSLKTGEIVGAEALIRWSSPELGMISPGEFIPIAEVLGLTYPISDWVLCEGLQQLGKWHSINPNFWLSFNLSAAELEDKTFIQKLYGRIVEANIAPHLVGLEITERVIYQNLDLYLQSLDWLKKMSVRLKVDDFGTGQAGLIQLLQFNFDEIKVDRSFMPGNKADTEKLAICKAIATIAQEMKFNLVAEGIETPQQQEIVSTLGYGYGQGYYFAKPMMADSLTKQLEENGKRIIDYRRDTID
ncbi:putative bifunctional diguanylate cyclase/phosphodiesterase [Crocosphaera chwakensis]|uniref:PAS:GGDEF n=1 Tax=Crocosphaera chwakensis CCY0110 TaxID=391612 RepID=A3IX14_9CHRO|nr:phosphodiesterase [Crocosphaera chwakensis]EAZ88956.1 PAS:GGDEF [Crocosphaera chwakensis CCY0110]